MKAKKQHTHAKLLRQYHAMCRVLGIGPDERKAIQESYGVKSSAELTDSQLLDLIARIEGDADRWRKRVMAVIGAYLRRINYPESAATIKAVACRAAGYDNINQIPVSRLREIYYEFLRRNRTAESVRYLVSEIEFELTKLN